VVTGWQRGLSPRTRGLQQKKIRTQLAGIINESADVGYRDDADFREGAKELKECQGAVL
jgi:hypothetical protein